MRFKQRNIVDVVLLLSLVSTLTVACGPSQPVKPPTTEDAGTASCASACERMRALTCALGQPTKRGASCETVCDNVWANNGGKGFPVACLTNVRTCAEAEACR